MNSDLDRSWTDGVLCSFDLETTGLNPITDNIVQFAVILTDKRGFILPESISGLVNPGIPISPKATAVHHITDDMVQRDGADLEESWHLITQKLNYAVRRNIPIVIFNAPFDLGFLHQNTMHLELDIAEMNIIDPLVIDREIDKYRKGPRTLEVLAAHYSLSSSDELHDAKVDSALAADLARRIGSKSPDVGDSDPLTLHHKQVSWYRAWADSYSDYLRRRGRAPMTGRGWPLPDSLSALQFEHDKG